MRKRSRSGPLVLAVLLVMAACSTDAGEESFQLHRGWYRLTTVDSALLPHPVSVTDDCTSLVTSGHLFLDDTLFHLSYQGPLECQVGPDGDLWEAFYIGDVVIAGDSVLFRMPDLSHLGLDSLNFTGDARSSHRLETVVPQIPGGTGPPVRLVYDSTAADPRE
jgi:hypothetical protein